jgi:hypothetical protein
MASVLVYFAGLMKVYIQSDHTGKSTQHLTYGELPTKQSQTFIFASLHALECPGQVLFL